MNKYNLNMCWCSMEHNADLTPEYFARRLREEWHELCAHVCIDELADVMLFISMYVWSRTHVGLVLPPAQISLNKGVIRVELWGCVRNYHNRCTKESC